MNKTQIKLVIYGAGGFLFFMGIMTLVFNIANNKKNEAPVITPTTAVPPMRFLTQNPRIVTPYNALSPFPTTKFDQGFTGVADNEYEKMKKDNPQMEPLARLRNEMPYRSELFTIEYSYKDIMFLVTITSPYGNNTQRFFNFLKGKGITYSSGNFKVLYK